MLRRRRMYRGKSPKIAEYKEDEDHDQSDRTEANSKSNQPSSTNVSSSLTDGTFESALTSLNSDKDDTNPSSDFSFQHRKPKPKSAFDK